MQREKLAKWSSLTQTFDIIEKTKGGYYSSTVEKGIIDVPLTELGNYALFDVSVDFIPEQSGFSAPPTAGKNH